MEQFNHMREEMESSLKQSRLVHEDDDSFAAYSVPE
jgi:hypothetical protein